MTDDAALRRMLDHAAEQNGALAHRVICAVLDWHELDWQDAGARTAIARRLRALGRPPGGLTDGITAVICGVLGEYGCDHDPDAVRAEVARRLEATP